jgi:lantibiotic modifying enzyme
VTGLQNLEEHLRFTTLLPADVYVPGLFTGTAGIGYELLRIARPELVGSALLWEP